MRTGWNLNGSQYLVAVRVQNRNRVVLEEPDIGLTDCRPEASQPARFPRVPTEK